MVKWHLLGVCIIATLIALEKVVLSRSEVFIFGSLELREYVLKVSLQGRDKGSFLFQSVHCDNLDFLLTVVNAKLEEPFLVKHSTSMLKQPKIF